MRLFLLPLLLTLFSCSPEQPLTEAPSENAGLAPLNLDRAYSKQELSFSCVAGCQYHYKIYQNANRVVKDSVSLSVSSLESIQKECERFCKLDVFYRLNQEDFEVMPEAPVATPEEHDKARSSGKEFKSLEDL